MSDVLNRGTSTNGYNEIIDIEQEGLENSFILKDDNQRLILSSTLTKSREGNGRPQLRRPEKQLGINNTKKIISNFFGPFDIKYDYRHIGKVEDWKNGSVRSKVDSSDIMNLSLSKKLSKQIWSLNIYNLTDEVYQRPDTYNQERRRISLSFNHRY